MFTALPPAKAEGQNTISAPDSLNLFHPSGHSISKQICTPITPKSVLNTGGSSGPGVIPPSISPSVGRIFRYSPTDFPSLLIITAEL